MDFKDFSPQRKIITIGISFVVWVITTLWVGSMLFLLKLGESKSYASPTFLYKYYLQYGHYESVHKWIIICAIAAVILVSAPLVAFLIPKKRKLYGEAKLGSKEDLKKAKMIIADKKKQKPKGCFFFMTYKGEYVYSPLDRVVSAILAAPPRSGKGTSQVQPNMLSFDGSAIVTDIRQESFNLTSNFRSKFSETYLINPFPSVAKDAYGNVLYRDGKQVYELKSHRYNPFFYVPDEAALRINELQKIASYLFPDPEKGDKFWSESARSLFLGIALYVFETEGLPKTLGEVLRQLQNCGDDGEAIQSYWRGIVEERKNNKPLSLACVQEIFDFLATGGNAMTSIRKTLTSGLSLWSNPAVDAMTSGNDFDLRDLRKKRMTIYLGVTPDNLKRAAPLLNLFLQQTADLNMQEMPADNPAIKYKLALILDEVTALGRMDVFAKAIGYMNGYWIMPYFIIQSFAQLRSVYGKEDAATIIDCCQIKIAFPPKSQEDAELLSKELGTYTEKSKNISIGRGLLNENQGTTSTSEASRALFLPQELRTLDPDSVIMIAEGMKPVIGKKMHYWKTPHLQKRVDTPCDIPIIDYEKIYQELSATKNIRQENTTVDASQFQESSDHEQALPVPELILERVSAPSEFDITTAADDIFSALAKAENTVEAEQEASTERNRLADLATQELSTIQIDLASVTAFTQEKEQATIQSAYSDNVTAHSQSLMDLFTADTTELELQQNNIEMSEYDIQTMLGNVIKDKSDKEVKDAL